MEIKRKIACSYLLNQYEQAKQYLVKEVKNSHSIEELDAICERVKRAGVAYAQTKCCVFFNNGAYGENVISRVDNSNNVETNSECQEFIDKMEKYIRDVIN